MKDINPSPELWEEKMECHKCSTSFTAEPEDLEVDNFKEPGTYWFDGSAIGTEKFYVWCPNRCDIVFAKPGIPYLLQQKIRASSSNG